MGTGEMDEFMPEQDRNIYAKKKVHQDLREHAKENKGVWIWDNFHMCASLVTSCGPTLQSCQALCLMGIPPGKTTKWLPCPSLQTFPTQGLQALWSPVTADSHCLFHQQSHFWVYPKETKSLS